MVLIPAVLTPPANAQTLLPGLLSASLVRTTSTAKFTPASPDPAGITYLANRDRLMISDSEVEEMPLYAGVNLFNATRSGQKTGGATTVRFSREPTGLAHNPANDHLFVSDDDADRIFEVAPGADRRHGTPDDIVTSFSTRGTGNTDAEGVAFDSGNRQLLVVDGVGTEVYRYRPGRNGRFDGVPPVGDDTVSHFDVGKSGAGDPEGIAFDRLTGTILVLDHKSKKIYQLTSGGVLLTTISVAAANSRVVAGIVLAPASNGSGARNLYIVDRGLDNDVYPTENDGKLYEMSLRLALP
jgi:hypothetical protein